MVKIEEISSQPVSALRERYLKGNSKLPEGFLEALEADPRRGARTLAACLRSRIEAERAEGTRLNRLMKFESDLWGRGVEFIAGVDEAGVGPMAGPLVAGAVILPRGYRLKDLDDSKKLDAGRRGTLARRIREDALAWSTGIVEVDEIEDLNVYRAGLLAMKRAIDSLSIAPDHLLVDARTIPGCSMPQMGIIRGDSLSASIAAASILAKTTRDAIMIEYDLKYPGYGFAAHKGYATAAHFRALQKLGVTPIHRRGYRPVREALGLEAVQTSLFEPAPEAMEAIRK
ncbi:MAG: ribonuclease HII [Acidobacteriota bacterium]|nr:MAG: ribonuclease HII [Acidobacteriota bacterium]